MSKLQELIKQHCPNGVEYKKLGEVCSFQRGTTITAKDAVEGTIPVIAGGKKPAYYHNVANRKGKNIVIAGSGAYAGYVTYWEQPIFVSDAFTVTPFEILDIKYVFYFLKNIQDKIHSTKKGSGVPHVHGSSIANIQIPVPPLEVQEEIVRILDCFADYSAELQAELQARKEQYEYYRDKLLSFNKIGGVPWLTMSEIFEIKNGYTPSKSVKEYWENGTIPWFRMEDIRKSGRVLSDAIQHITPQAVKGGKLFSADSFILATTATIGEHALLLVDSLANQRFSNFKVRGQLSERLNIKYLYYYFFIIDEWCKNNTNVSGFASVDMAKLKKLLIPIPSLAEQERIVGILDKFETLVNDLSEGLPSEIAAVGEQYEYYRNKLLTFPRA